MSINSPISSNVDLERDGKQVGYLSAPQSTNSAGWANYFLPIAVIKNGPGPTALIFGGNHGDEYEGPVTLMNLARELQPEMVRGRLIFDANAQSTGGAGRNTPLAHRWLEHESSL